MTGFGCRVNELTVITTLCTCVTATNGPVHHEGGHSKGTSTKVTKHADTQNTLPLIVKMFTFIVLPIHTTTFYFSPFNILFFIQYNIKIIVAYILFCNVFAVKLYLHTIITCIPTNTSFNNSIKCQSIIQ